MATAEEIEKFVGTEEETGDETPEEGAATPAEEQPTAEAETPQEAEQKQAPSDGEDLKAKVEELEKANRGMYQAMRQEREQRQAFQTKVDQITGMIQQARTQPQQQEQQQPAEPQAPSKIDVAFDDDGNPYIPSDVISKAIPKGDPALENKIANLENELAHYRERTQSQEAQTAAQQQLNKLLAENEAYPEAHKKLEEQFTYLKDELYDAYIEKAGLNPPQTAEEAIDIALKSNEIKRAFNEKFPGADLESVMEANLIKTPRLLRRALDKQVPAPSSHQEMPEKPSALSSVSGSESPSDNSIIDRVADMDLEDFLQLDDKTYSKIDELLKG